MGSEIWVLVAVLRHRTRAGAVGQDGLQAIEVAAHDIGMLVHDQAGKVLTNARPHDARLAVMDGEAFFPDEGRRVGSET
jgi:hypothetical protein